MERKKISVWILVGVMLFLISGCGNRNASGETKSSETSVIETKIDEIDKSQPIKVGCVSGALTGDVFNVAKEVLEEKGYQVEVTLFSDFNAPNAALNDGSIDYNFYQHLPFMKAYNESKKTELVEVGDGIYSVIYGLFSKKITDLQNVEKGMVVAIPNDNANRRTNLTMLEEAGLIKIKEGIEFPTVQDLSENKYDLQFIEMEGTMTVSAIEDVDLACVDVTRWVANGGSAEEALATISPIESALVLVTKKGNEDTPLSVEIFKALKSDEVKMYLEKESKGQVNPLF